MLQKIIASIFIFLTTINTVYAFHHEGVVDKFKRPVGKISAELGITAEQFKECFKNVKPAPQGTKPTKQREHANKKVLLPCLQKANPNITNDLLDKVTDKYRPEGKLRNKRNIGKDFVTYGQ